MTFVITKSTYGSHVDVVLEKLGKWIGLSILAWDFLFLYRRRGKKILGIEELVTHKALIAGEVPNHYCFFWKGY